METDSVASKVSERLPTVLSGFLVLLADGNLYTKTATGTKPVELKKVEPNKMLKLSFLCLSAQLQPIVEWHYTHVCICLHLHSKVTTPYQSETSTFYYPISKILGGMR